ncbi:uncharacterized protein LOC123719986 isoform X1 [Pieris brassicae]|uniref:uncharacterized protein LOC123719986 isoform X1 n=1 Tax=Pieris brassicae TaxID=7116 RepID=UPI001E65E468|nr:uncharacterized protein LOC123719986 isoform X1 [Pieris brassicae]XP_045532318.1 uncharacterized protein LOC123719986 isoform X1 [Pieris brassicae]
MKSSLTIVFFAAALSLAFAAPQFITFQDGKLGVNFAGYHAGVGVGGLLANGTLGGLYAEAGTPTGQSASAGLGGVVNKYGHATGGLFAGATAGNNIQAAAGLSGGLDSENSAGTGFATAQAGNRITSSGLGGHAGVEGSSGFTYSGKEVSVIPAHSAEAAFNVNANVNEVQPLPESRVEIHKTFIKQSAPPPVIVKEVSNVWSPRHQTPFYRFNDFITGVYNIPLDEELVNQHKVIVESPPPPPHIVEKHIIHTHHKHKRPHVRKTAFVSGYIGGGGNLQPAETVVYQSEPAIDKRLDVGVQAAAAAGVDANPHVGGGIRNVYRKEVSIQRNPSFFSDIFNIPISTLKAVGNFLGNTASNTNISVQKSASVETGTVSELKHYPSSSSSSSSSHISVQTPTASKFIDDILSIPISTLGAVNRFLENNVARKSVQVSQEVVDAPSRIRRVPHGRRRANKVVGEQPSASTK